jgi:hypothetical protein
MIKYLPWVLLVVSAIVFFKVTSCQSNQNDEIATYNRQILGQLSETEEVLQRLNIKLGISKSELLTQQELYDRLQKEKQEVDEEFEAFVKEYNLQIKEKDLTIAQLQQQISGGYSSTDTFNCDRIPENCVIAYDWSDPLSRFQLQDPNIFEQNNEIFRSSQLFKIYGEVYSQEDGSLLTKRLVLREVYKDGDEYKEIDGGKAEIIDSKFEYSNEPASIGETTWRDLFKLRVVAVGSANLIPDSGSTNLGLGLQFFEFHGFGLNSQISFNFTDAKKIEPRIGIGYTPEILGKQLNVALGVSVGTPFYRFFNEYSINADLIFYLHE